MTTSSPPKDSHSSIENFGHNRPRNRGWIVIARLKAEGWQYHAISPHFDRWTDRKYYDSAQLAIARGCKTVDGFFPKQEGVDSD